MENHGVLNWRKWSIVRKTQIIAAAIGFFASIGVYQAIKIFCHGESLICLWLITPGRVLFYPVWKFANWCGLEWKVSGIDGATPLMIVAMILFNTITLAIIGTIFGFLLKFAIRSNR